MKTKRTTIKRRNIASLLRGKSQAAERLALVSKFPLVAPLEISIAETSWQPVPSTPVQGEGVAAFALAGF
jgi:hypothetical protein